MSDHHDDPVEELLVEWELARKQGIELSVEELCTDAPDLANEVRQGIAALQATAWMLQDETEGLGLDDSRPAFAAAGEGGPDDSYRIVSDVTVKEFLGRVSDSGILSDADLQVVNQQAPTDATSPAQGLAERLVDRQILTAYQARTLLKRGNDPLLLDRYIILDTIGAGGMGLVFKALHRSMERVVAIKVLPGFAVDSPKKVSRFQREIKAAGQCSHPNVVAAYDAHESNGAYFLVMEYVPGVNLREHVDEHGPFSINEAVRIVADVSAGLSEAHRHGIIHRDVKPTNIMLAPDGAAKLLDLGLARTKQAAVKTSPAELTKEGLGLGTVAYMAPEQALDAKQADVRSDIYSLGCTLYFLLVGKSPFERSTSVQTIVAHREERSPTLCEARHNVPSSIERIYERMVAKDPADRFQSAEQLRRTLLETNLASPAALAPRPPVHGSGSSANRERFDAPQASSPTRKGLYAAVATLAALALAIALMFAWRPGQAEDATHHDLASWVLSSGGWVTIENEFGKQEVDDPALLPLGQLRVVGVEFYDIRRLESIEPLSKISGLKELNLANRPSSLSLSSLQDVQGLTSLQLGNSNLQQADLQIIGQMSDLRALQLANNPITDEGVEHLAKLSKLERLSLSGTNITGGSLNTIKPSFPNLHELAVAGAEIAGSDLGRMPEGLRILRLTDCPVSDRDVPLLQSLQRLELLDLDGTDITGASLASLAKLQGLRHLDLSNTSLTATALEPLASYPKLTMLILNGVTLSDEMIEAILHIEKLESLELRNTNLNDAQLARLSSLEALHTLDLRGTLVTQPQIDQFFRKHPTCSIYVDEHKL